MVYSACLRRLRPLQLLALTAGTLFAADQSFTPPTDLLRSASVQAALAAVQRNEPEIIELQVRLNEIPAPPFKEAARAAEFKQLFEALGLENVFIDAAGNVLGTRRGAEEKPHLVVSAHLDTVFPEETDVRVRRDGTRLSAPGIGDDARGLAELISVVRALREANVQTRGTITFVGTVGEEGLGDLRGVKQLFNETLKGKVDAFISIDGGTPQTITNGAVGSYRYRVTYRGPGGHSYGAFGMVNPAHALGRAIAKIAEVRVPPKPKTTFTVGRIGGGTSVNSIPFEAWMEIDMRSDDPAALNSVRENILATLQVAAEEENSRWPHGKVAVEAELVGNRPAGSTPADTTLVQAAQAVIRALGGEPQFSSSSTDSNYPMSLGIPAITVGTGGRRSGAHSLAESFDTKDSWQGPRHTLLLVLALTQ